MLRRAAWIPGKAATARWFPQRACQFRTVDALVCVPRCPALHRHARLHPRPGHAVARKLETLPAGAAGNRDPTTSQKVTDSRCLGAQGAACMRASLGLLGIRQRRAGQGDLCSHAHGRHGCSMPVVPKRGRLASGRLTKRGGTGRQPGRTGRPGWAIGNRRADGGCQPFPARWIFWVGTFRPGAVESRDAASRACRSHATVRTILPRVWPCSTVRRPSAVSARG